MSKEAELILDTKVDLGEGPIWDVENQLLYWVNIMESEVLIYNPQTEQNRVIDVGQYVGTVVKGRSGLLYLALHHGFASLDLATEEVTLITDPEADLPTNRFNDGKCDPAGRFWAGTMSVAEAGKTGSLYILDTDGSCRKMVSDIAISNGIVWSLDAKTMYYIDTPTGTVDAFDYDLASGNIGNRRSVITIPEGQGFPDGMTGDAEGMLWVAHWGGHRITRWNPVNGELLDTVHVPAAQVTACAFGGPNLDELYITCARRGLDATALAGQPLAGGLFKVSPGVKGLPAFEYADAN
ncbi:MAG: SMP-30/gluconolactonase/LRE family protein [Chloroflexota bacterium]